jgi:MFS family permease
LLSFPYKKEEEYLDNLAMVPNEDNFEEQNSDKEKKEERHYSVQLKNENNNNEKEENESLTLKESLLSKDFFLCLTIASCTLIFGFLLTNTYRPYGELAFVGENKDKEIKTLSKVFTLLNTFSRLLWGYISDKIRFKILYPIVCINQLICGSLIYFSSFNIVTYYIVVNLAVLSFSGHVILFPTLIHTKFGVENSVYLLGICGIFIGAVALVGPIITLFALPNIKDIYVNGKIDYDELNKIKKKYLMIYLIGAAPTIISLIISIFIKVQQKQKQETKKVDDNYDDDEEEDLTNKKETVTGVELNKKK